MLRRLYFISAYYLSWIVFGAGGMALNIFSAGLLLLPGRHNRAPVVREAIRRLFSAWVGWLHATGLARITWHFTPGAALTKPAVYVSNHPGLLDATFLLARLPDALCIFKPSMRRNPFLAPAAIVAGYASRDTGIDLIREVAEKVTGGCTLLVFPEGTRTDAERELNPLKPGFALIARRAGVPVQVLVIRASRDFFPRGQRWWRVPGLPARVDIHVERLIPSDCERPLPELVAEVERCFVERLATP